MMRSPRALCPLLLIAALLAPCVSSSEESLQELLSDLEGWDKDRQVQAAVALGEMGPAAQVAVPALMRVIKTGRPEPKVVSSIALLKIDPDMKDVIPMLLRVLDTQGKGRPTASPEAMGLQDDALRKWSALMRSKLDPKILPALTAAVKADDPDIRILGVLVLGGISRQTPGALPHILKAYDDPDAEVREAVIGVLSRIGPKREGVVPGVLRGLKDQDPEVRVRAVQALSSMGQDYREAWPMLVALLKDPSLESSVRLQAADLLAQAGFAAEEESASITDLLEDPDPAVRGRVIQLLAGFGPAAVPALLESLRSPRMLRCSGAIQALTQVGPVPPELLPALTGCLKRKERSIRYLAAEGLRDLGVLARAAIPDLVEALKDPEESVRASAGNALLRMGEPAVAAIEQASSAPGDLLLQARASALLKKVRRDESP